MGGNRAILLVPLPAWVAWWFMVAVVLVSIDCTYVLGMKYGESDAQYSGDGVGMEASNGWIITQSLFNVAEVFLMVVYLIRLQQRTITAALTALTVSVATFWKTCLYMPIILHSEDPVSMVPLLRCTGMSPLAKNAAHVQAMLAKEGCGMQFFKFQFNFWWIVMPFAVAAAAWSAISHAVTKNAKTA
ncbi:hypothetical protein, variant [Aphanomyces invadans]|uniref:Uncharacterized protein n=1 Tax=Aphanomyces invadans TaxID=157072 RepID=A0A024U4M2_9STRA|nr:hypothetical protein, variant [Aphanomyces invadans]ETW01199.1 hypothetical protein, variant [Aphanomyces invadans]|eukprot:XP_008870197.1 hypothetical protein, variant [Aphanomyces invadans]